MPLQCLFIFQRTEVLRQLSDRHKISKYFVKTLCTVWKPWVLYENLEYCIKTLILKLWMYLCNVIGTISADRLKIVLVCQLATIGKELAVWNNFCSLFQTLHRDQILQSETYVGFCRNKYPQLWLKASYSEYGYVVFRRY